MPKTPFNSPEAAPRPTKGGGGGNNGSSKAKVQKLQIPEPGDVQGQGQGQDQDQDAADFVVVESRAELESTLTSALPKGLRALLPSLSEEQRALVTALCHPPCDQAHLFASWDDDAISTERKLALIGQLSEMDATYPTGGLAGYIANARTLLSKSRRGENPLDGWRPEVPRGEAFEVGMERWAEVEQRGVPFLGRCGFVLVAGGLGERLGYGDIKVS